jgi:hypothetical protein
VSILIQLEAVSVSSDEDTGRLADDLASLGTGQLSEREFRATWQAAVVPRQLGVIWANLEHYLADLDIRERDSAYRAMQDGEMGKLVRLLRAGASADELARITFLGHS